MRFAVDLKSTRIKIDSDVGTTWAHSLDIEFWLKTVRFPFTFTEEMGRAITSFQVTGEQDNNGVLEYLHEVVLPKLTNVRRVTNYLPGMEKYIDMTKIRTLGIITSKFNDSYVSCTNLKHLHIESFNDHTLELIKKNKETLRVLTLLFVSHGEIPGLKQTLINLSKLKQLEFKSMVIGDDISGLTQVKRLTVHDYAHTLLKTSARDLVRSSFRLRELFVYGTELTKLFEEEDSLYLDGIGDNKTRNDFADEQYLTCLCLAKYRSSKVGELKHFLPQIGEYLCFMRPEQEEDRRKKIKLE